MTEKKRKAVYNPEADARWAAANREHKNYLTKRSHARSFIRTKATLDDLKELQELIDTRLRQLTENWTEETDVI